MGLFRIEIAIAGKEAETKARFHVEAEDTADKKAEDVAKEYALEKYKFEVLPRFLVVYWEGPLEFEKVSQSKIPPLSGDTT